MTGIVTKGEKPMNDLDELARQIRDRLADAEARRRLHRKRTRRHTEELEQRQQQFRKIGNRLIEAIIAPRMQQLVGVLDNAECEQAELPGGARCVCQLWHTVHFPATTKIDLAVYPDERVENILVVYKLEVLPIFLPLEGPHEIAFPLNEVDDAELVRWVDEKIIRFVDTYLRLEYGDQYPRETLAREAGSGAPANDT